MAKIYAGQGHYERAADIYRHLLSENPERPDWDAALKQIEAKLSARAQGFSRNLTDRLAQWIGLMLDFRRLRDLQDLEGLVSLKKMATTTPIRPIISRTNPRISPRIKKTAIRAIMIKSRMLGPFSMLGARYHALFRIVKVTSGPELSFGQS
jgi:hypothetical protein